MLNVIGNFYAQSLFDWRNAKTVPEKRELIDVIKTMEKAYKEQRNTDAGRAKGRIDLQYCMSWTREMAAKNPRKSD